MLHTTTNQLHEDTKFIQNNQFQKKRLSSSELLENYKNTYNTFREILSITPQQHNINTVMQ